MALPGYTDYEAISQMNPGAAFLAMEQAGLEQTFRQQQLAQEQEKAKAAQLANIFTEQTQPGKIEQAGYETETARLGMGPKRTKAQIEERTAPQQMELALKEMASKLTGADITMMEQKGRQMAMDKDPEIQRQGLAIMQMTPEFIKLKQQYTQQTELEKLRQAEQTKRTGMTIAAQKERAAAGKAGKAPLSLADQIAIAKTPQARASAYMGAAIRAEMADEPEQAAQYRELYEQEIQKDIAARQAAAQVAAGGQVSLEELEAGRLRRERDIRAGKAPPTAAPAGTPPTLDIKSQVEQQGGKYDPQKFEYRINPQTGKVQSRPKG